VLEEVFASRGAPEMYPAHQQFIPHELNNQSDFCTTFIPQQNIERLTGVHF
jgi:hypothetical protein